MIHCERAHAKVNLHLEVLIARQDGFHDLLSAMATVGLHDLLKLDEYELLDGKPGECDMIIRNVGGSYAHIIDGVPVEKNLITRAAKAYLERIGRSARIAVKIEKNIPAGGGLGGGSADAAAMLRLLDRESGRIGADDLRSVASVVGADVPFCISGGCALCEGIGDRIEQLEPLDGYSILLANNGVHVDTGSAYRMIDDSRIAGWIPYNVEKRKDDLKRAISSSVKELGAIARNDFEGPVFAEYPSIEKLKEDIRNSGAVFTIMTGSGSTIVGIFDDDDIAKKAHVRMIDKGIFADLTRFVDSEKY